MRPACPRQQLKGWRRQTAACQLQPPPTSCLPAFLYAAAVLDVATEAAGAHAGARAGHAAAAPAWHSRGWRRQRSRRAAGGRRRGGSAGALSFILIAYACAALGWSQSSQVEPAGLSAAASANTFAVPLTCGPQAVGLGGGYTLNVASAEAAPEEPTPQARRCRFAKSCLCALWGRCSTALPPIECVRLHCHRPLLRRPSRRQSARRRWRRWRPRAASLCRRRSRVRPLHAACAAVAAAGEMIPNHESFSLRLTSRFNAFATGLLSVVQGCFCRVLALLQALASLPRASLSRQVWPAA